jgi:AhpD family alkylhydroperoxidase
LTEKSAAERRSRRISAEMAMEDHTQHMSHDSISSFEEYRSRMNGKILESDHIDFKRFFALDASVYRGGALDKKTKELLGLTASTVLRCNDCILYHVLECVKTGVTDAEFREAMSVALAVGCSITIPHLRFAFDMMERARSNLRPGSVGSPV